MPRYRVSATLTISVTTEVEAATEEEAREIADGRDPITLCHQCAGSEEKDEVWVTSGELDGAPEGIVVERVGG